MMSHDLGLPSARGVTTGLEMDWVPESCSLPTHEQPSRVAAFDTLFSRSVLRVSRPSATTLRLVLASDAWDEARSLAADESDCCWFFDFRFSTVGSDILMSVVVPPSRASVLDSLARRVKGLPGAASPSE